MQKGTSVQTLKKIKKIIQKTKRTDQNWRKSSSFSETFKKERCTR